MEEFNSHYTVDQTTGCWIWIGTYSGPIKRKRASFRMKWYGNWRTYNASKAAWLLFRGKVPNGKWFLHAVSCLNTRSCVNPAHLYVGTATNNIKDTISVGHFYSGFTGKGTLCVNAVLTEVEVREIRDLYEKTNWSQQRIAGVYSISQTCVSKVCSRDPNVRGSWSHID
jgi:hypothetical protein